jgi:hypothetical protein
MMDALEDATRLAAERLSVMSKKWAFATYRGAFPHYLPRPPVKRIKETRHFWCAIGKQCRVQALTYGKYLHSPSELGYCGDS